MPPAKALQLSSRRVLPACLISLLSCCLFLHIYVPFIYLFSIILSLYHPLCFYYPFILPVNCPSFPPSLYFLDTTILSLFPLYFLLSSPFFSPVLPYFSFLHSFPLSLLSSACCCSFPHLPLPGPCQPMPAAQGTLSPLLPKAEVSEMGTDVVVVPCGGRGYGMQVCVICVCVCSFMRICVYVSVSLVFCM